MFFLSLVEKVKKKKTIYIELFIIRHRDVKGGNPQYNLIPSIFNILVHGPNSYKLVILFSLIMCLCYLL